MDFSVIRPKPPFRRPQGPPPWAPAPPQPPLSGGPPPPPPPHRPPPLPHGKAPPPHTPVGPYMEEMDRLSRVQRMRSIEYTNARTWRMNFGEYPNDYSYHYGDYEYSHHPVGVRNYDHHHMLTGPSPPRLGLPPPDYHHGPPAPPPANYYYPPPYNGGFFSDENPNGCMIM